MPAISGRADRLTPVEAQGLLRLDGPRGRSLRLEAEGATLRLIAESYGELRSVAPPTRAQRRRALAAAHRVLHQLDLSLEVRIGARTLLGLGRDVRVNWLARVLGYAPARVPFSALAAMLGRR